MSATAFIVQLCAAVIPLGSSSNTTHLKGGLSSCSAWQSTYKGHSIRKQSTSIKKSSLPSMQQLISSAAKKFITKNFNPWSQVTGIHLQIDCSTQIKMTCTRMTNLHSCREVSMRNRFHTIFLWNNSLHDSDWYIKHTSLEGSRTYQYERMMTAGEADSGQKSQQTRCHSHLEVLPEAHSLQGS